MTGDDVIVFALIKMGHFDTTCYFNKSPKIGKFDNGNDLSPSL